MSQNEIRINNKVVVIPKDSFEQDEFIGLWRQAQEKAINVLKYDIDYIKDLDKTKNNKVAIVNSNNPIKNTPMAKQFCTSKQMDFDLISATDSKQFLKIR